LSIVSTPPERADWPKQSFQELKERT
jgi:hypothetical protein